MGLLSRRANDPATTTGTHAPMHQPATGPGMMNNDPAYSGTTGPNTTYNSGATGPGTLPNGTTDTYNTGSGTGLTHTGPTSAHGTHTGPAPLLPSQSPTHSNDSSAPASPAQTLRQASKLERKANTENTLGSLLCSASMKHKSEVHRAEAGHLRMQASELGEAQKLEHEAGIRRQRAVGLGADPAHAEGRTGFGQGH